MTERKGEAADAAEEHDPRGTARVLDGHRDGPTGPGFQLS